MAVVAGAFVKVGLLLLKAKDDALAQSDKAAILLIKGYEDQIKSEQSQKASYKGMYEDAMAIVELNVPKKVKIAAVVPESNSPPTQEDTADVQTARARITAATLALGLPIRIAGPAEVTVQQQLEDIKEDIDKVSDKTAELVRSDNAVSEDTQPAGDSPDHGVRDGN